MKHVLTALLGLLCGWGVVLGARADETVTLAPQADNWISSCYSGSGANNGGDSELWVRSAGLYGDIKNFRSLLRFNLGDLPSTDILVHHGSLNIYYFTYGWDNPLGRSYTVHRVTSGWEEMQSNWYARDDYDQSEPVYWDSYYAGVPPYRPGGGDFDPNACASATVPAPGNWMSWDVTGLVQEWVDQEHANEGLLVKDANEIEEYVEDVSWGPAKFRGQDYWDEGFRPFLEVTFNRLGDLNCDGSVNGLDIDPFVLALTSGPTYDDYYAVYEDCDHVLADTDRDGSINGLDTDPFVELLTGQ